MPKIYKYPLEIKDSQILNIPKEYEILSVQMQNGVLCLWAEVIPEKPLDQIEILVIGTGQRITDYKTLSREHLGTVQDRAFVWHVFKTKTSHL